LLSDFFPHGKVARSYGVLRDDGRSERAIFVIDRQRVIRFAKVYGIDDLPDNDELFAELSKLEPSGDRPVREPVEEEPQSAPHPFDPSLEVTMYCTSWCPACRRARNYLKANRIPFKEIDIGKDREAAARVRNWADGNETTPVFEIGDSIVINFNRSRLDSLLNLDT
jgi:glutaredoxin